MLFLDSMSAAQLVTPAICSIIRSILRKTTMLVTDAWKLDLLYFPFGRLRQHSDYRTEIPPCVWTVVVPTPHS